MNPFQQIGLYNAALKTITRNTFRIKIEPELSYLPQLIKPGFVCIDIGAAHGQYALSLSKLTGTFGHVYCFEPADYNNQVLHTIIKFYRLQNVTIVKQALSDQEGPGILAIPIKKNTRYRLALAHALAHLVTDYDSHYVSNKITITTLDTYTSQTNIKKIDFIKCDVEGAELKVFQGGGNVISHYKPIIICEVYKTWLKRFNNRADQLFHFFFKLGYHYYWINHGKLTKAGSLDREGNYLFIHPQSQN